MQQVQQVGDTGGRRKRSWIAISLTAIVLAASFVIYLADRFEIDMRGDSAFVLDRGTNCLYFATWIVTFHWLEVSCP